MVCVPCIVVPVLLWVFHKYIQPILLKFWNPWKTASIGNVSDPLVEDIDPENVQYQFIQNLIKAYPVVVFSKTTCRFSKMAKEVLDGVNVEYELLEINARNDCDEIQDVFAKMTGARTVPRVFIGERCIGGGSDTWSLHNQGKLLSLLQEAGAHFKKNDKKTN